MAPTDSISFCVVDDHFRPSVLAAINSARFHNPAATIRIFCNDLAREIYAPRLDTVDFHSLHSAAGTLHTTVEPIAERRMRAYSLWKFGGWYIDAFDTITLRQLPAVDRFTVGESCWSNFVCAGIAAAPKGCPIAAEWLTRMIATPDETWDHWTDERTLGAIAVDSRFVDQYDRLDTGKLHWPSETGWGGELMLSENHVSWIYQHAWIVHYFFRGAFDMPYKEMTIEQIEHCAEMCGWLPREIVRFQSLPTTAPEFKPLPQTVVRTSEFKRLKTWE